MKKISQQIADGKTLISDGAWGTFLYQKGLTPGDCPELWCIDRRSDLLEIARSYIDAGSDMVQSNSFGASSFKLDIFGLSDRVGELNEAAASISREAAGPDRHVIASVGPTGKMLVMGDVSREELYDAFKEQVIALERGGADACCIETMSDIDEATLAVKAAKENTGLEIICTFSFERTAAGEYRTMMGVSPSDMAKALCESGADIVGTDCGNGMQGMIPIVEEIRAVTPNIPILVHANAGMPVRVGDEDTFPDTPEDMAKLTPEIIKAGANIVGGCCGTTPAHIRAMADALRG
jgi:5-methyltetrahydrofolate--homocysteine methyltransferase